jgi:hypothetical protein
MRMGLIVSLFQRHGALINKKGGYYHPGKLYASSLAEMKVQMLAENLFLLYDP